MSQEHERPVALITGAGRRVGAVIARTMHAAGYDLALHFRGSAGEALALSHELDEQRVGSTLLLQADLADLDALPRLVERVLAQYGRLDALINNASSFYPTPVGTATVAQWNDLFASNAQAPFFLSQAAAPALRAARGSIVNLVDIYAERPLIDHSLYSMAKAALAGMTRSLAIDLSPDVRVNGVAPGVILLPEGGMPSPDDSDMVARTPLGRIGRPDDAASAVLWLVRDASYVTGQIIRVDGGRSLLV
jgi:pteridine reductase